MSQPFDRLIYALPRTRARKMSQMSGARCAEARPHAFRCETGRPSAERTDAVCPQHAYVAADATCGFGYAEVDSDDKEQTCRMYIS